MITPGTILIDPAAPRPKCFQTEDDSFPNAWTSLKHSLTSFELEEQLAAGGWTFIYVRQEIGTTSIGLNRAKMVHAALDRLITAVKQRNCNCLEIDEVATRSMFGLRYVSITARSRQLVRASVHGPSTVQPSH